MSSHKRLQLQAVLRQRIQQQLISVVRTTARSSCFHPLSQSARSWIEENLPSDAQWFGSAVAIEHRYIWPILEGIQNDGLAVKS
jgi:hypothetical protein